MRPVSKAGLYGFLVGFAGSRRGSLVEQPFASSEMGESMDADLLPEFSGETWVVTTLLEGLTADLLPAGADLDLIVASRQDTTLAMVREWVQSGTVPLWADCAGLSPELRCWQSVHRYGRAIMEASSSSVGCFSASGPAK